MNIHFFPKLQMKLKIILYDFHINMKKLFLNEKYLSSRALTTGKLNPFFHKQEVKIDFSS